MVSNVGGVDVANGRPYYPDRESSMLRYRADLRSLAFIATYFALVVVQWIYAPHTWWIAAPLLAATFFLSWDCAVITHNTVHSPVFRVRWMNRVMQVALSLSYGFPVSEYLPGHNLSHHKHTQKAGDLMRTSKLRYRWNLLNVLLFFAYIAPGIFAANMRYVKLMKTRRPRWRQQLMIETVAVWAVKLTLLAIDWRKALVYVVLPHLGAVWGITTVNYLQHDGCDEDDAVNHSRNFVGRIFNWFTFNNGFHGMHHIDATLHWSKLAEAHARVLHPTIHPALEQKSLFLYLVRAFVIPGKRLRYDGKPVVLPPEEPDADWVQTSVALPQS